MKYIIKYIIFTYLLTFLFIFNVRAECSYQERKELLKEAKNVNVFFEANENYDKFILNVYNLTDNIYITLENPLSFQYIEIFKYMYNTDFYTYEENNITDAINYKLKIYSNKAGCYGNLITSKYIKKPIINKYYKEDICKGIEDFKYCIPIINERFNISDAEILNEINIYKKSIEFSEEKNTIERFGLDDLLKLAIEYWYIELIIIIFILLLIIIRYIIKKRGELK